MTQKWTNKRSKITWSVDIVDEECVFIYRNNMTKTITLKQLHKNYIKESVKSIFNTDIFNQQMNTSKSALKITFRDQIWEVSFKDQLTDKEKKQFESSYIEDAEQYIRELNMDTYWKNEEELYKREEKMFKEIKVEWSEGTKKA